MGDHQARERRQGEATSGQLQRIEYDPQRLGRFRELWIRKVVDDFVGQIMVESPAERAYVRNVDEITIERALRQVGQLQHFSEAQIREIALIVIAVIRAEDPARQRRDADARADRDRLERLGRG